VVEAVAAQAAPAMRWLIEQGVPFSQTNKGIYHLNREGGHSARRILHQADRTGSAVMQCLAQHVAQAKNIHCHPNQCVSELLVNQGQCNGAYVLNTDTEHSYCQPARITVLATGGCSSLFQHSTNPDSNTGDGLALAWQAGCKLSNLEFHQFHPTALFHPESHGFLISEALRGEGGTLCLPDSLTPFMHRFDPRGDVAPRDIVSRAIVSTLAEHGCDHVVLNMRALPATVIRHMFPTIAERCQTLGLDITRDPIPVVPAAHYSCGGIVTNLNGQTDVAGLYAIGEVTCTGLHGANRLASNSLLECLVMARNAAQHIPQELDHLPQAKPAEMRPKDQSQNLAHLDTVSLTAELRQLMNDAAGIIRHQATLEQALEKVIAWQQAFCNTEANAIHSPALLSWRHRLQVCRLILQMALDRRESRGAHARDDYPQTHTKAQASFSRRSA
jgi:L-aspartate oxidase